MQGDTQELHEQLYKRFVASCMNWNAQAGQTITYGSVDLALFAVKRLFPQIDEKESLKYIRSAWTNKHGISNNPKRNKELADKCRLLVQEEKQARIDQEQGRPPKKSEVGMCLKVDEPLQNMKDITFSRILPQEIGPSHSLSSLHEGTTQDKVESIVTAEKGNRKNLSAEEKMRSDAETPKQEKVPDKCKENKELYEGVSTQPTSTALYQHPNISAQLTRNTFEGNRRIQTKDYTGSQLPREEKASEQVGYLSKSQNEPIVANTQDLFPPKPLQIFGGPLSPFQPPFKKVPSYQQRNLKPIQGPTREQKPVGGVASDQPEQQPRNTISTTDVRNKAPKSSN